MRERIARAWRVGVTGSMIGTFAVWVAVAVAVFLPFVWIAYRDERSRLRRVRLAASRLALRTTRLGERLGAFRLEVEGAEHLRGPRKIAVANHPTMIDALALLPLVDEGITVTTRRRWDHPVMRQAIAGAGFLFADGPELVEEGVARVEQGASLVMFPEGTRSLPDALEPFKRGAAHIALRTGTLSF